MATSSHNADTLTLERQLSFALSVAARHVLAVCRPLLAELNLTHPQYLVMLALWQHGPLSVSRLGSLLQLDSGTLSPLLKRLAALGHLRRERSAADERSVIIDLTPQGEALRAQAESVPSAVLDGLGMRVEEVERLHSVLADVIATVRHPEAR
ncbi:MarR family winged helix-turn-helix transcriptional regulator [Paractinoplanes hotanensis]|uniref:MarR family transcriptional regulator n=1 Tax=Paractinoplanes hotanensis TaxID=2906497 RepID=A0ABT0YG80_9ACTN|nr:MarR family transcriptional regulator [Actinoplanes hotanensis]MCM4085061.1 MarR family transcriptional regulator [Actinoplanes hotanensis]